MIGTGPLRTVSFLFAILLAPAVACAQSLSADLSTNASGVQYELGGSAMLASRAPDVFEPAKPDRNTLAPRFPDRIPIQLVGDTVGITSFGEISVFGGEDVEEGQDTLHLGTALTRGRTTTGISITYRDEMTPSRSEVFVDYALSENISVGVSGILSEDAETPDESVARFGLSAAYASTSGTFIQGGFADAPNESAVFGLAVGLKF